LGIYAGRPFYRARHIKDFHRNCKSPLFLSLPLRTGRGWRDSSHWRIGQQLYCIQWEQRVSCSPAATQIPKKIVVDEKGSPVEVILPWKVFCEVAEILGLDLDAEAEADLREARRDLEAGNTDAFVPLPSR
jgi:hypothetical protein